MKIVRFKHDSKYYYGVLEGELIKVIKGDIFGDYQMSNREISAKNAVLLNPVFPPNIIAIGLNYKKHAKESGHANIPEKPIIFLKATSSIIGPEDLIKLPLIAPDEVDYEAELAVVIGKEAKDIEPEEAEKYIWGYTCANDVSARDCQFKYDNQWARSKSFDTFCPVGPWIETQLDAQNCRIESKLNGEIMQSSSTSDMIFSISDLISYCSKSMTLLPGSIILTGTPEGVGFSQKPPVFLKSGDIIEVSIQGIGTLSNKVSY